MKKFTSANVIAAINEYVEKRMTTVTRQIVYQLYALNPEDTGFSETNWLAQVGAPVTYTLGEYDPTKTPIMQDIAGQLAMVTRVKQTYQLRKGSIYISNNVDYVKYLEGNRPYVEGAIRAAVRLRS